jgi:hypothetical protein
VLLLLGRVNQTLEGGYALTKSTVISIYRISGTHRKWKKTKIVLIESTREVCLCGLFGKSFQIISSEERIRE